jgi:hypothetical protein
MSSVAQQAAKAATALETAKVEFPAVAGSESSSGTEAGSAASPATATAAATTAAPAAPAGAAVANPATTTTAPASVAVPLNRDLVIKELSEMKARIAELEAELKARSGAEDAADADKDANALRTAEGDTTGSLAGGQAAAAPPAAAAPAPPEITAETTTRQAPFPGDWTWLNSGGHNVDSPMSTKYFTPEIRFDANYILDYNHPEDDSMGGSTEMFRSDEWQLEQVSVGGDFRIQNVRGRILTMDGLFATTTPRNDASYNRGQWQLSSAYRYSLRHGAAITGM